jgi:hypothetical protein
MIDRKLLGEVFRDVKIKFGLRAQGYIPIVEAMLADGKTWDEIGKTIGWNGRAVKEWYEIERNTDGLLERD